MHGGVGVLHGRAAHGNRDFYRFRIATIAVRVMQPENGGRVADTSSRHFRPLITVLRPACTCVCANAIL